MIIHINQINTPYNCTRTIKRLVDPVVFLQNLVHHPLINTISTTFNMGLNISYRTHIYFDALRHIPYSAEYFT